MGEIIGTLQSIGLKYIGTGMSIIEAEKTGILEKNGLRNGIYNSIEHVFSVTGKNSEGANPYDLLRSFDQVEDL